MNEILDNLRHLVVSASARKIGIVRKELVINIIDSVVTRPTFEMGEGTPSIDIEGSMVTRPVIKTDDERKKREEERLRKESEEQERLRREREEGEKARKEEEERKKRGEVNNTPISVAQYNVEEILALNSVNDLKPNSMVAYMRIIPEAVQVNRIKQGVLCTS